MGIASDVHPTKSRDIIVGRWSRRAAIFKLGPEIFDNRSILIGNSDSFSVADTDGIIGENYLRNHRVLIAHHAGLIYLGYSVPRSAQK